MNGKDHNDRGQIHLAKAKCSDQRWAALMLPYPQWPLTFRIVPVQQHPKRDTSFPLKVSASRPFLNCSPLCEPGPLSLPHGRLTIYTPPLSGHQDIFPANSIPLQSYLAGLFFLSSCITLGLLNLTSVPELSSLNAVLKQVCSRCVFSLLCASPGRNY